MPRSVFDSLRSGDAVVPGCRSRGRAGGSQLGQEPGEGVGEIASLGFLRNPRLARRPPPALGAARIGRGAPPRGRQRGEGGRVGDAEIDGTAGRRIELAELHAPVSIAPAHAAHDLALAHVDDTLDLYGDKGRGEVGCDVQEGKVSALVVAHLDRVPVVG